MAKDSIPAEQPLQPPNAQTPTPAVKAPAPSQTVPLKKLIIIGVPVFFLQLVVVYFLAAKFFGGAPASAAQEQKPAVENESAESLQQNIYVVKDVIINPAGTNGGRFLLATIGIEVTTPEAQKELERKDVQVRDILNSVLASKSIAELVDSSQREALRVEIARNLSGLFKTGKMKNVYFSKYIIQ